MTSETLRFRLAEPDDAPALGEFMARNFLASYGHCSTPDNIQRAIAEHYGDDAQRRQIGDPTRWNLIALIGDTWVGHAQLHFRDKAPPGAGSAPAVEVARFYVDTTQHGRGIAQTMMTQVKTAARARGGASLWLSVWQDAPQAIRFYDKEGFRQAGALIFMVGDDPKNDWLMVFPLD